MFRSYREINRTAATLNSNQDEKKVYDCDLCDSGDWLSETEVELHKRSMHSRYIKCTLASVPYGCWNCAQIFEGKDELIEHIKYTHLYSSKHARRIERKIFICDYCHQIFFNRDLFEIHVAYRHMPTHNSFFKCPLCHKKKHARHLLTHMMSHNIQSVSVCQICLIKQRSRKALEKHLETHPKYLQCDLCGHISIKEKHFNFHVDSYERRHKRFDVKNYQEYFLHPCKKTITWAYHLKQRLCGINIFNELYICILCRHLCLNHNEMQTHIFRDHSSDPVAGKTAVTKVCSCGEQFSTMILLKHHIFKTEGDHRLSYTEIDRTTHDSDDDDLTSNSNHNETNTDPEPEIIVLDIDENPEDDVVCLEPNTKQEKGNYQDSKMDSEGERDSELKQEIVYSFENI